ncbi:hypothetical protein HGA91_01055 [candidate division WWE3 bacterium]|nr:hypothetical protein [candidate division WWE3 bacterium]
MNNSERLIKIHMIDGSVLSTHITHEESLKKLVEHIREWMTKEEPFILPSPETAEHHVHIVRPSAITYITIEQQGIDFAMLEKQDS